MRKPAHIHEVFLNPGDFYFGAEKTRIVTLLGSCISITVWHPVLHIGGMCHYLLPSHNTKGKKQNLDGRYADEAVQFLLQKIAQHFTQPQEYQVKIFGGGNMFSQYRGKNTSTNCNDIGTRNIEAARWLLKKHDFPPHTEHVGDEGHRKLIFNLWDGNVWVRHVKEDRNRVVEPGTKGVGKY